jgi:hypothetical protein
MQEFLGNHYVLEKHANEGPKVANANGGTQGNYSSKFHKLDVYSQFS